MFKNKIGSICIIKKIPMIYRGLYYKLFQMFTFLNINRNISNIQKCNLFVKLYCCNVYFYFSFSRPNYNVNNQIKLDNFFKLCTYLDTRYNHVNISIFLIIVTIKSSKKKDKCIIKVKNTPKIN